MLLWLGLMLWGGAGVVLVECLLYSIDTDKADGSCIRVLSNVFTSSSLSLSLSRGLLGVLLGGGRESTERSGMSSSQYSRLAHTGRWPSIRLESSSSYSTEQTGDRPVRCQGGASTG